MQDGLPGDHRAAGAPSTRALPPVHRDRPPGPSSPPSRPRRPAGTTRRPRSPRSWSGRRSRRCCRSARGGLLRQPLRHLRRRPRATTGDVCVHVEPQQRRLGRRPGPRRRERADRHDGRRHLQLPGRGHRVAVPAAGRALRLDVERGTGAGRHRGGFGRRPRIPDPRRARRISYGSSAAGDGGRGALAGGRRARTTTSSTCTRRREQPARRVAAQPARPRATWSGS